MKRRRGHLGQVPTHQTEGRDQQEERRVEEEIMRVQRPLRREGAVDGHPAHSGNGDGLHYQCADGRAWLRFLSTDLRAVAKSPKTTSRFFLSPNLFAENRKLQAGGAKALREQPSSRNSAKADALGPAWKEC